jgi:hypothetical protein
MQYLVSARDFRRSTLQVGDRIAGPLEDIVDLIG